MLWAACLLLVVANVFNIAADLGGMGEAMHMVTGIQSYWWTPFFAILITCSAHLVFIQINRARVQMADAGAFRVRHHGVPRPARLGGRASLDIPAACGMDERIHVDAGGHPGDDDLALPVLLAGFAGSGGGAGTGPNDCRQPARGYGRRDSTAATDVRVGMFYSNLVMYFILLTTAATLHAHGMKNIETAQQAAEALRTSGGQRRLLAFHAGSGRNRNPRRAGARGIVRVCDRRSRHLA